MQPLPASWSHVQIVQTLQYDPFVFKYPTLMFLSSLIPKTRSNVFFFIKPFKLTYQVAYSNKQSWRSDLWIWLSTTPRVKAIPKGSWVLPHHDPLFVFSSHQCSHIFTLASLTSPLLPPRWSNLGFRQRQFRKQATKKRALSWRCVASHILSIPICIGLLTWRHFLRIPLEWAFP